MIVKEDFVLLKDTKNVLNVSSSSIKAYTIPGDTQNLVRSIKLIENQITHFTKKRVLSISSDLKTADKNIEIVNFEKYQLPVTYNRSSKKIVINLNAFSVSEISKLDYKTIYGCIAYGICFRDMVTGKAKIRDQYFSTIVSYLNTVFVRVFGKEYGLLGVYSEKLPKMQFLISCYILAAFFGIKGKSAYKKSSVVAAFSYKDIEDKLGKYDFSRIDEFIKSLSELEVMPGMNKYAFTAKFLRFFGLNFIPATEDISRFMSSITVANISGANIVPAFIYSYNLGEYNKLLSISKHIFK